MSWADKELRKHRLKKEIDRVMASQKYKDIRAHEREQDTYFAIGQIAYYTMEYLEMKHRYGHNGLTHWLQFLRDRINETGDDPDYLSDVEEYYREKYDVEIVKKLGFKFERKAQGND